MAAIRLFCPSLAVGANPLSDEESRHAIASLRVRVGDDVTLFDGVGSEADGAITTIDGKRVVVSATGMSRTEAYDVPLRLTLAVAMPKTHRQGYLIEKCTELGVAAVWPVLTERSVTKSSGAAAKKWARRAVEASKQSGRRWVPVLEEPMPLAESLDRSAAFDARGWADVASEGESMASFLRGVTSHGSVLVWIGPEGGFTEGERRAAMDAGATPLRLGPTVLRTETAAVAVCAAANLLAADRTCPGD